MIGYGVIFLVCIPIVGSLCIFPYVFITIVYIMTARLTYLGYSTFFDRYNKFNTLMSDNRASIFKCTHPDYHKRFDAFRLSMSTLNNKLNSGLTAFWFSQAVLFAPVFLFVFVNWLSSQLLIQAFYLFGVLPLIDNRLFVERFLVFECYLMQMLFP